MSTVAFLGVGAMGLPMAAHVAAAGHHVRAFDPSSAQLTKAELAGLATASGPPDAVSGSEFVVIMVATPDQLLSLFTEPDGITAALQPGQVCIVMSTVGIDAVVEVTRLVAPGIDILDVPVTGGAAGAEAATLTLLAGGAPEVVDRCRPVLDCMGQTAECGPNVGDGQAVKLVNQLLCSVHLVAAAEALAFAGGLGLDPAAVLDIVSKGAANSWMLEDRGPRLLAADPPVRSTVDIFLKDSSLVSAAARACGLDANVLFAAADRFREASARGWGRHDDSTVIRTYTAGGAS